MDKGNRIDMDIVSDIDMGIEEVVVAVTFEVVVDVGSAWKEVVELLFLAVIGCELAAVALLAVGEVAVIVDIAEERVAYMVVLTELVCLPE